MNLKLIFLYKYFWLFWFKLLLKLRVKGLENFPNIKKEGVLFISNHAGHTDAVLIGITIPWSYFKGTKTIRFMTHYKYIKETWYGSITKFCGGYSIYPNGGDLNKSMGETIDILKNKKHNVLMFPQGKKEKKLLVEGSKSGLGYIAKKINPQIVPVYIGGTHGLSLWDVIFKQKKVTINFGKPFYYQDVSNAEDDYRTISKNAMERVVELENQA
ncbi:MAG: lysophospholipid acyltransferase family protein [Patescibacteria group bacterium]|jgi:1-acyl-sn-glycerol-3-phosphate acyltransferase|nr:lysophospholipid acyltransferase family protein [Patescibacteria group bacterium]